MANGAGGAVAPTITDSSYWHPWGIAADTAAILLFLAFYCNRVGGVSKAWGNLKATNLTWLGLEVALPLGIPVAIGIIVIGFTFLAGDDGPIEWHWTIEELTPWTLCFFSMTILSAALRRLYNEKAQARWLVLTLLLLMLVSGFAGVLTYMHHKPEWKPGFRPYSGAILFTLISVWMSHAREEK